MIFFGKILKPVPQERLLGFALSQKHHRWNRGSICTSCVCSWQSWRLGCPGLTSYHNFCIVSVMICWCTQIWTYPYCFPATFVVDQLMRIGVISKFCLWAGVQHDAINTKFWRRRHASFAGRDVVLRRPNHHFLLKSSLLEHGITVCWQDKAKPIRSLLATWNAFVLAS